MKKINIGVLIASLSFPVLVGGISAAISAQGMEDYSSMVKPTYSPEPWVFSMVWIALYLLMGLASYMVLMFDADLHDTSMALILYLIQLVMNFLWSIIFFVWKLYLPAYIWLIAMILVTALCTIRYYKISKPAAGIMALYILWLMFAAHLNMSAYILN